LTETKFCSGKMKNRLYELRTQRKLSLMDVCELYKANFGEQLSVKTLRALEKENHVAPLNVYIHLADLFDVTLDFFLARADAPAEEIRMHQKGLVETEV